MPVTMIRFRATNPDGKQFGLALSAEKYTPEEIAQLGEEFKQQVKDGVYTGLDDLLDKTHGFPYKQGVPSSDHKESGTKFEFRPMTEACIELPDDKFGNSHLCIGATRSGKSTLMNWLYDTYFRSHVAVLHTASHQSEIYKSYNKAACVAIAPQFMPELITESSKINSKTGNHYKILHILDDIVDKKNSKELIKLLTIGRNHRLSTIITGQELSIFNSIGRSNINFIYCFRMGSDMAIEKVVRTYLRSAFPQGASINEMIAQYKKATENHGFFMIDNIHDKIFLSRLSI